MDMSVGRESKHLLTASGDGTVIMWMVETGEQLAKFNIESYVPGRAVEFDASNKRFAVGTGRKHKIFIYDVPTDDELQGVDEKTEFEPVICLSGHSKEVNTVLWGPANEKIYSCSNDGTIKVWNIPAITQKGILHKDGSKTIEGDCEQSVKVSEGPVNCMAFSKDKTMIVAGCDDTRARLYDTLTLECKKTYNSDKPVKDVKIHPHMNIVLVGGGQHARDVTTTKHKKGKFEAEFYHLVQESKFGIVKTGHFSPINCVTFSPDGKTFCTGAEEGNVRIFKFEDTFEEKFKQLETSYSSTS